MPRVSAAMIGRMGALSAEARLQILYALRTLGTASAADVATAVGLSRNRLWPHLRRLTDAGLIKSRGQGRGVRFSVSAAGLRAALADVRGLAKENWPKGEEMPGPLEGEQGS